MYVQIAPVHLFLCWYWDFLYIVLYSSITIESSWEATCKVIHLKENKIPVMFLCVWLWAMGTYWLESRACALSLNF